MGVCQSVGRDETRAVVRDGTGRDETRAVVRDGTGRGETQAVVRDRTGRDETRAVVRDIRELLDDIRAVVRENNKLLNKLLCSNGDTKGVQFTVKIRSSESENIQSHGLVLVRKTSETNETKLYLVSAAHVLVEMIYSQKSKQGSALVHELLWGVDEEAQDPEILSSPCLLKNLYLPENYVLSGKDDIACSELHQSDDILSSQTKLHFGDLSLKGLEVSAGKLVVGHGQVFLRGTIIQSTESRMLMDAPSVPGCSGCPLFDEEGELVALVHGASRHRGTHSDTMMSRVVYADCLKGVRMRLVPDQHRFYKWLRFAGEVPLEAQGDGAKIAFSNLWQEGDIPCSLKKLGKEMNEEGELQNAQGRGEMTVDSLMERLHKTIWKEDDMPYLAFSNEERFLSCELRED